MLNQVCGSSPAQRHPQQRLTANAVMTTDPYARNGGSMQYSPDASKSLAVSLNSSVYDGRVLYLRPQQPMTYMPALQQQSAAAHGMQIATLPSPTFDVEPLEIQNENLAPEAVRCVRLLISNTAAGSLIGKCGHEISSLRSRTGCSILISPPNQNRGNSNMSSGTRSVSLSGTKRQMDHALLGLMKALRGEKNGVSGENGHFGMELRFLVPNSTVSVLIGKRGERISQLRSATGAKVLISGRDQQPKLPNGMRTITVQGDSHCMEACVLGIVDIFQEDPEFAEYLKKLPLTVPQESPSSMSPAPPDGSRLPGPQTGMHIGMHNGALNNVPDGMSSGMMAGMQNNMVADTRGAATSSNASVESQDLSKTPQGIDMMMMSAPRWVSGVNPLVFEHQCEVYLQIPNVCAGNVVGRNGQRLALIRHLSGARVNISAKGELVPGTDDRLITLGGTVRQIHVAHIMIVDRLMQTLSGCK